MLEQSSETCSLGAGSTIRTGVLSVALPWSQVWFATPALRPAPARAKAEEHLDLDLQSCLMVPNPVPPCLGTLLVSCNLGSLDVLRHRGSPVPASLQGHRPGQATGCNLVRGFLELNPLCTNQGCDGPRQQSIGPRCWSRDGQLWMPHPLT